MAFATASQASQGASAPRSRRSRRYSHQPGDVTGGRILRRVDVLLIDAVNRVADQIALQIRGEAPPSNIIAFQPCGRRAVPLTALAA